jgi:hypothetical protein
MERTEFYFVRVILKRDFEWYSFVEISGNKLQI